MDRDEFRKQTAAAMREVTIEKSLDPVWKVLATSRYTAMKEQGIDMGEAGVYAYLSEIKRAFFAGIALSLAYQAEELSKLETNEEKQDVMMAVHIDAFARMNSVDDPEAKENLQ